MSRARIAAGPLVAAALLLAGAAKAAQGPAATAASPAAPAPDIRAQLAPRRYTTLSAELGARIEHLALREGDHFRRGEVLATLECALQRANLAKARAELEGARQTRQVDERLHAMNAGGALEAAVAAANADRARADVAAATAIVDKCTITAPFSGEVAALKVREQQYVQPGTPLMDILDNSSLDVEFLAPSRWLMWLKAGQPFRIAIDETGKTYPARVTRLGARVNPVSQSVKVVGEIVGKQPDLIAGMSGRVLIRPPR